MAHTTRPSMPLTIFDAKNLQTLHDIIPGGGLCNAHCLLQLVSCPLLGAVCEGAVGPAPVL